MMECVLVDLGKTGAAWWGKKMNGPDCRAGRAGLQDWAGTGRWRACSLQSPSQVSQSSSREVRVAGDLWRRAGRGGDIFGEKPGIESGSTRKGSAEGVKTGRVGGGASGDGAGCSTREFFRPRVKLRRNAGMGEKEKRTCRGTAHGGLRGTCSTRGRRGENNRTVPDHIHRGPSISVTSLTSHSLHPYIMDTVPSATRRVSSIWIDTSSQVHTAQTARKHPRMFTEAHFRFDEASLLTRATTATTSDPTPMPYVFRSRTDRTWPRTPKTNIRPPTLVHDAISHKERSQSRTVTSIITFHSQSGLSTAHPVIAQDLSDGPPRRRFLPVSSLDDSIQDNTYVACDPVTLPFDCRLPTECLPVPRNQTKNPIQSPKHGADCSPWLAIQCIYPSCSRRQLNGAGPLSTHRRHLQSSASPGACQRRQSGRPSSLNVYVSQASDVSSSLALAAM
ncbi:hypothetical protein F5I97DRAFT_43145 [Phlebopus sp. FC_14]|nr:hypothetical protein F5I97DRAFT_43145 [Phlebopus sp. FC_14]